MEAPDALVLDYDLETRPCEPGGPLLTVQFLDGGVSPYDIVLNQQPIAVSQNIQLTANTNYQIIATDANGCTTDVSFESGAGSQALVASITPDTTIKFGESVRMEVITSNAGLIDAILWDPAICVNCFDTLLSPVVSTAYTAVLTDTNGCSLTLVSRITVKPLDDIDFPNVFAPNTLDNEFFTVILPVSIASLDKWAIFDRWGDQVYLQDQPFTDRYIILWDGKTANGKQANPGVYVFYAEGTKVDGTRFISSGDVTIIR